MEFVYEWLAGVDVMMGVAYVAIIVMAAVPIYIGSFRALKQEMAETMTTHDAYMFPVMGSCVLFGLYVLFKFVSKEYVNMLLTAYFLLFGVLAVSATIRPFVGTLLGENKTKKPSKITFSFPWQKESIVIRWKWYDIVCVIIGSCVGAWYIMTKHWIANNIIGLSFSIQGISFLMPPSYQIACILLVGLFFYDIFWVFATEVMVTVAKSFDAPVKLLFPKDIFADELQFSMLGLGDIVIPGMFIALMLRFDAHRARGYVKGDNFNTPYFNFTYIAYILGMATTIFVMHTFRAAQPALLYLVPACIGSSLFCAALLGEVSQLSLFDETNTLASKKSKKNKSNKNKKKGKINSSSSNKKK